MPLLNRAPINFDNCAEKTTLQPSGDENGEIRLRSAVNYGESPSDVELDCVVKIRFGQNVQQKDTDAAINDLRRIFHSFAGEEGLARVDEMLISLQARINVQVSRTEAEIEHFNDTFAEPMSFSGEVEVISRLLFPTKATANAAFEEEVETVLWCGIEPGWVVFGPSTDDDREAEIAAGEECWTLCSEDTPGAWPVWIHDAIQGLRIVQASEADAREKGH
ncbi:MAG: hypothetical protein V4671_24920 [Armatimonadota bacterium]